jgi:hypothetical protein
VHLEKRQTVMIAVGIGLILLVLAWKFFLVGGDEPVTVEDSPTVTTVATAQAETDPADPAAPEVASPSGSEATPAPAEVVEGPFDPLATRDPFVPAG